MKKLKKIFVWMLTLVMALSLSGIAAFAAEGDPKGTITIKNATEGKTYNIYKIFDANPSSSEGVVAYTATEEQKGFYENSDGNPFTFTKNISGGYNVSKAKDVTDKAVIEFLQGFYTEKKDEATGNVTYELDPGFASMVTSVDPQTATGTTVEFAGVPYGYYLITSNLGAIITLDSTNPEATVIDKNQTGPKDYSKKIKIGVDESGKDILVSENSANYGDTVDFQIKFQATNYAGEKKITKYEIEDTIAKGLELDTTSFKVTVGGEDAQPTYKDMGTSTIENKEYNKFTLGIDWQDAEGNFKYSSPVTVTITYSATVKSTDETVIADVGNKNIAQLIYYTAPDNPDDPDDRHEDEKSETTTYVYALGFHKIDGKTKGDLSGAEFTVKTKNSENNIGAVKNADGTYSYTNNEDANPDKGAGAVVGEYTTTFVSDDDGLIVIKGLKEGTYTVTETKAPEGYNMLEKPIDITASISETSTYTKTTTTYYDKDGNISKTEVTDGKTITTSYEVPVKELIIENNAGAKLPSTGGIGTTVFYVLGGILVIGAGILLITKKRMKGRL